MAPGLGVGVLVFAAALLVGASPGFLVGVACGVASGLVLSSVLVRRAAGGVGLRVESLRRFPSGMRVLTWERGGPVACPAFGLRHDGVGACYAGAGATLCAAVLLRPCLPHPFLGGAVPYAAFVALCPVFLLVLGLVWARRRGGC